MWVASLILAASLIAPDPQQLVIGRPRVAAGGCNEFEDDFTTDLSDYTVHSNFTHDATNDEVDYSAASSQRRAMRYDTAATDGDHFAVICLNANKTVESTGVILRAPGSGTADVYVVGDYNGYLYFNRYSLNTTTMVAVWECDMGIEGTGTFASGDCIGAAVSGTGASTSLRMWFWDNTSPPGSCPSDWGTADYESDMSGCRVDTSNAYTGVIMSDWSNAGDGQLDDFAMGDDDG